ncbi:MAG TPA: hypothetical protein IAC63_02545 [Candidatus Enterousia avicola]|uniref:Uncharacterized protein n=1 Tax=Candidatus Enterousia avicola TaxID=2840787 RepID=A0A9D1SMB6_9PROT|nr:hypothetical protein [Candidatus Enterousia avicola]
MKKSLKLAVAASVLATPAMAANLENPLYLPESGDFYSKTGAGVMYKVTDDTDANKLKGHAGATEFPIWRVTEDLGYGITDSLAIRGSFAYTQADDIDRKGLNHGRLGLIWRPIETTDNIVLDIYADAHLGGVNKMRGSYTMASGFKYDNYSNGRWGADVGVRFGKTWSKLTTSAFVEVLKTFGSDNNVIDVSGLVAPVPGMGLIPVSALGVPSEISVDLKSTTEINFGLNAFYQLTDRWSFGGGFKYNHHADNGVKSLSTELTNPAGQLFANTLISQLSDMNDGFDEYIVSLSVANQLTDAVQVALYGEYTFDTAHANSQNGSDVKAEVGVRLNLQF